MRQAGVGGGAVAWVKLVLGMWTALVVLPPLMAQSKASADTRAMPAILEKDGRFALMVDGEPYLMLGVQANNSSAWPEYLDKVWPAAETLHANTVELPIYWEQMEPTRASSISALSI